MPLKVRIVTTRTSPSTPLSTLITCASGHLVGAMFSFRTHTMLLTSRSLVGLVHLLNLCSWLKYSADHCCKECWTSLWQSLHRWRRDISIPAMEWSGRASIGLSRRKWPGVNTSAPPSASSRGVSGLEWRHASICANLVVSSSNVKCTFPTILGRWYLKLFTTASHRPPKCSTCSGMKCCRNLAYELLWPLS